MSHWTCFIYGEHVETKPFRLKWLHDPESCGLQRICGRKGWFIPNHRSLPTKKLLPFWNLWNLSFASKKLPFQDRTSWTLLGCFFWSRKSSIPTRQTNKNRLGLHLSPTPHVPNLKSPPQKKQHFHHPLHKTWIMVLLPTTPPKKNFKHLPNIIPF